MVEDKKRVVRIHSNTSTTMNVNFVDTRLYVVRVYYGTVELTLCRKADLCSTSTTVCLGCPLRD